MGGKNVKDGILEGRGRLDEEPTKGVTAPEHMRRTPQGPPEGRGNPASQGKGFCM